MEFKEAVKYLKENGGVLVENAKITSIFVNDDVDENAPCNVSITIDKEIEIYQSDENGQFVKTVGNRFMTTDFSLRSLMRNYPEMMIAVNECKDCPVALETVFMGATIDIIQEPIANGQLYTNPFSSRSTTTEFDHDTIINHVVGIKKLDDKTPRFGVNALNEMYDRRYNRRRGK